MRYGVRKFAVSVAVGVATLALVCGANAQDKKGGPKRARRETNAARQARIARTVQATYSHRYEVFGGGGYMRFRSGEFTKKNNEVTWAANTSYFLTPKVAVVADARGMFGNANALTNNVYGVYHPQINEYTFMGGGSYRFYAHEKTALSVQALGGVGWGIFYGGSKGVGPVFQGKPTLGMWADGFKPAFSIGISGDYNFYPNLAFRVTPTYVATMFNRPTGGSAGIQNNIGINMGIVYRFGKPK